MIYGIIIFSIIVLTAVLVKSGWRPGQSKKTTNDETPAGGGNGGSHHQTPAKKTFEDRVIGVVEIILTVIIIAIGIMIIWFLYAAVQWIKAPPTQAPQRKIEKIFVLEKSCTTPCKMDVAWGKKIRSNGFPIDIKFFQKEESFHLSGSDDEKIPKEDFSPGEASIVSSNSSNPNVLVKVGHYETKEVQ